MSSSPFSPESVSTLTPLVATDLSRSYGDRCVLDGFDLVAAPGQPLGLVGENGAGKSTVLRLLSGEEAADAGDVSRPADLAYLAQEPDFGDAVTLGDVLEEALAPLHRAVARLEELAASLESPDAQDEFAAVLAWSEHHDAWDADRRAEVAAVRLGLSRLQRDHPVAAMSGGQRCRLALAALIARRPTCVLLDEPTNHLDDEGVAFLEEFLVALPGVVVVASHDRAFLDNVCAAVVDLDPEHVGVDGAGGNRFGGGYTAYLGAKRAARQRWAEQFAQQQEELAALRRAAATTARQVGHNRAARDGDKMLHHKKGQNVAGAVSRRVRDAERRMELIERDRVPKPPRPLRFSGDLAAAGQDSGLAVLARDLVVPGRLRLPYVALGSGERLLVTGPNGSGKSTLLAAMAGVVTDHEGTLQVHARRRGHLPQHVHFGRPDLTAREAYRAATGAPVPLADLGLIHPREHLRPVGVLSLGQQRRLALAILVARRPDLLLLDEPTNHISLALAEELEEALQRSVGTVVVTSHDRWLRRRWEGETLAL